MRVRTCAVWVALLAGCGAQEQVERPAPIVGSKASSLVSTFLNDYLEIDETTAGGDANLILNGTNQKPQPVNPATTPTWTDWTNVNTAGHRFLDVSDPDTSSFPRSIGCVGSSKVLSKMDLTYVGLANNQDYAYFAVQRANNNGDAGYYWLMTKKAPSMQGPVAPCKEGESLLQYEIGPNDVLLAGHFQPSASPLLRVFVAQKAATLDAIAAIDFTDTSLWKEESSAIAAVAVNRTNTPPGTWGSAGVAKQALAPNGDLTPELFAEAALKTSIFTGGSICGAKFFGTVITRSSGSGGTSPDLKDFFGPEEFSFGSVSAKAALTPSCGLSVGFSATATGIDGAPLSNAICTWSFTDGNGATVGSSANCSGSFAPAASGTFKGTVTVKDPGSNCSDTITTAEANAYPELVVQPVLAATCASSYTYDAVVTGGSNPAGVTYAWSFPGDTLPTSSTTKSGAVNVGSPGTEYEALVTVTDPRTDVACTAGGKAKVRPLAPLAINLKPSAAPLTCDTSLSSDAATYVAYPSGGNGSYAVVWSGGGCAPGTSCTIDPADNVFCTAVPVSASVSDTSGLCPSATSETELYTKTTTITVTNN
ncbi:MAG: PKD domain-containing protein [Deltaproteobacteria bacterium]|nr:PKD domain-containing protein [Deltaproteobacteria bacterium]